MKVRVLTSSFILDFANQGFDSIYICSIMKKEAEAYAQQVKSEKLADWEVCFRYYFNNTKSILVYLREKSDVKDKYKEITVHIPIPTKDRISWGINIEQHIYQNENHLDNLVKNFLILDVDYSKFTNRQEYIIDCMRRSINLCFEKGFTVNGEKVRVM